MIRQFVTLAAALVVLPLWAAPGGAAAPKLVVRGNGNVVQLGGGAKAAAPARVGLVAGRGFRLAVADHVHFGGVRLAVADPFYHARAVVGVPFYSVGLGYNYAAPVALPAGCGYAPAAPVSAALPAVSQTTTTTTTTTGVAPVVP